MTAAPLNATPLTAAPLTATPVTAAPDRIAALPDHSPAEALVHLADQLSAAFDLNLGLLMAEDSPDPVHKARVALRRFRALLDAFAPILDDDLADSLHDRSRALFRALGAIRDADVMALRFAETDRAAKTAAQAAHQRLKGRKALKKQKAAEFRNRMLKRLAGKGWRQTGKKARSLRDAPLTVLATLALNRAWEAALSNGPKSNCPESNGPDLARMRVRAQHDLRKDLKNLRYLAEFFADLWPDAPSDLFLADLRALQDDLGELSDSATARALGHKDSADTTAPQARAGAVWAALIARGPWWQAAAADRED